MKKSVLHWIIVAAVFGALLIAPQFLNEFRINLMGKFLTYAIVAVALDLIWGYGGMLSLGQGLFFSLGAYMLAMHLKLENSGDALPDFMVWSQVEELWPMWEPFQSAPFALAMVVIVPTVVAFIIGYLIFRSRVQGVYFSIITQAMTLIFSLLFIAQQPRTGGTNGLTDLQQVFGFTRADPAFLKNMYFISLAFLFLTYLVCWWVTNSRFGRLLVATRDDESRVRFLGFNPVIVKTLVFSLAGALTGIAGALYVVQDGIISPAQMGVKPSIEMVIWTAVGGRGTLIGGIIGAITVGWSKSLISAQAPEIWEMIFGALFVFIVLFLPKGIAGTIRDLFNRSGKTPEQNVSAEPAIEGGAS